MTSMISRFSKTCLIYRQQKHAHHYRIHNLHHVLSESFCLLFENLEIMEMNLPIQNSVFCLSVYALYSRYI